MKLRYFFRPLIASVAVSLCLLAPAAMLHAQAPGGLAGVVTDTSGAVVPGAQIEVISDATGAVTRASASEVGSFSVAALQPGTYTVRVTSSGFTTYVRSKVLVDVATSFGNPLLNTTNNYNYATGFLLNYVVAVRPNLVATAGASWVGKLDGQSNAGPQTPFSGVINNNSLPTLEL